jgi:2-methylcitrate dehydratase PrpD
VCRGFCSGPLAFGERLQIEAAFNIPYTVACALLRKEVKPDYFTDAAIKDPEIQDLIMKISLVPAIPPEKGQHTEINMKMKDGWTLMANTDFPKGHYYESPITYDEIKAKFRNNVAYSKSLPSKKAEKALSLIEKLEDLKDVRELIALFVK